MWHSFGYRELLANQRQSGDPLFGELLGRLRIGQLTAEDIALLQTRIIPTTDPLGIATQDEIVAYFLALMEKDSRILAIFPTNIEVTTFNNLIVEKKGMAEYRLICSDVYVSSTHQYLRPKAEDVTKAKKERPWQQFGKFRRLLLLQQFNLFPLLANQIDDLDEQKAMRFPRTRVPRSTYSAGLDGEGKLPELVGGLPDQLYLGIGTRVMLRKNIDNPTGLVNSAIGTVTGVELWTEGQSKGLPSKIWVRFDSSGKIYGLCEKGEERRNGHIFQQSPAVVTTTASRRRFTRATKSDTEPNFLWWCATLPPCIKCKG